ncbi:hypothetical protein [Micromonospora sp. NPDC005174]|uniref:hypothetical protein n=1 Tax=Micromonospora sp. NPDC005174 TaxID=3157018 RepID=UPI0033A90788
MAVAEARTPAGAGKTGDRWRWRGYCCLAAALPFALFGYDTLFWFLVVASFACAREAASQFGWRAGYLDCKTQAAKRLREVRRG